MCWNVITSHVCVCMHDLIIRLKTDNIETNTKKTSREKKRSFIKNIQYIDIIQRNISIHTIYMYIQILYIHNISVDHT